MNPNYNLPITSEFMIHFPATSIRGMPTRGLLSYILQQLASSSELHIGVQQRKGHRHLNKFPPTWMINASKALTIIVLQDCKLSSDMYLSASAYTYITGVVTASRPFIYDADCEGEKGIPRPLRLW